MTDEEENPGRGRSTVKGPKVVDYGSQGSERSAQRGKGHFGGTNREMQLDIKNNSYETWAGRRGPLMKRPLKTSRFKIESGKGTLL